MNKPRRVGLTGKFLLCGLGVVALASLLGALLPPAKAAQVRLATIALRQAIGRVVFCVTKDTIVIAAVDDAAAAALRAPSGAPARPPAIAPIGAGRVAVVLGAAEWTRDDGKPMLLEQELPAMARKVFNSSEKISPLDQSANDIEAIGVTALEFLRPYVEDIHSKLTLAADEPLFEILLAGYTDGYGFEIWDLKYRVQQKNLGNDYWDTRPMRPSYYQLYPPEKGQPRTFIEAQYPPKLTPLGLARAAQSDPAVAPIRNSSQEINAAVTAILNGESIKAATRPVEDFLRLAMPVVAGAQAKLAVGAIDQQQRFQWLLAPENLPAAPAETSVQPTQPGQPTRTEQTDRPSLRRAGPPTTR
jgi:hypothetical protein